MTKEEIEITATEGRFLYLDYEAFADLNGSYARKYLEGKGFKVVKNANNGHNGYAITECGIYLSTNGYIHKVPVVCQNEKCGKKLNFEDEYTIKWNTCNSYCYGVMVGVYFG